jgi:hypothetical protein
MTVGKKSSGAKNGAADERHSALSIPARPSDIAGRAAIGFPKTAAEVRKIAEAGVMGDFSYLPVAILRLAKHAISAGESMIEEIS